LLRALLGSRLLKASFLTRLACAKLALNRRPVDEVMVAEVFGGANGPNGSDASVR